MEKFVDQKLVSNKKKISENYYLFVLLATRSDKIVVSNQ